MPYQSGNKKQTAASPKAIPIFYQPGVQNDESSSATKRAFPKGARPAIQDIMNNTSITNFKIRPLQPDRYYLTHGGKDKVLHFINRNNPDECYSFTVGKHLDIAEAELYKRRYIAMHPDDWQEVQRVAQGGRRGRRSQGQPHNSNNGPSFSAEPVSRAPQTLVEKSARPNRSAPNPVLEPLAVSKDASYELRLGKHFRDYHILFHEYIELRNELAKAGYNQETIEDVTMNILQDFHSQQQYYQPQNNTSAQDQISAVQENRLAERVADKVVYRILPIMRTSISAVDNNAADINSKIDKLADIMTKVLEHDLQDQESERRHQENEMLALDGLSNRLANIEKMLNEKFPRPSPIEEYAKAVNEIDAFHMLSGRPKPSPAIEKCNASHQPVFINKFAFIEDKNADINQEKMLPESIVKQMLQEDSKAIAASALDVVKQIREEQFNEAIKELGDDPAVKVLEGIKTAVCATLGKAAANLRPKTETETEGANAICQEQN